MSVFKAGVLVALLVAASALLLSALNPTGKAATGAITGTIVLTDHLLNTQDYNAYLRLPGSSCTGDVNFCWTDGSTANSYCRASALQYISGNRYKVDLPPSKILQSYGYGGRGGSKIFSQTGTSVQASCGLSGNAGNYNYCEVRYCGVDGTCDNADDRVLCSLGSPGSGTYAYPPGSVFKVYADPIWGGDMVCTASASDIGGLPYPATHVSVSYEC